MSEASNQKRYRQHIYERYVSGKTSAGSGAYSEASYIQWLNAARGRFAGWFPEDRNSNILDIGCGNGNFLYMLTALGYRNLVGIDLSQEQLEKAKMICPYANVVHSDCFDFLRESTDVYDLISCLNVIEHLGKDELFEFLGLVSSRLRVGGRLVIETPNAMSPWFGAVAYGDLTHEWFFTPSSLEDVLALAGFANYQARSTMYFSKLNIRNIGRMLTWKGINLLLSLWNMAETGGVGMGIHTRVFVATATKT